MEKSCNGSLIKPASAVSASLLPVPIACAGDYSHMQQLQCAAGRGTEVVLSPIPISAHPATWTCRALSLQRAAGQQRVVAHSSVPITTTLINNSTSFPSSVWPSGHRQ